MYGKVDLRTKALVFSVGLYNQVIGSGVQVGIGDVVQSTGVERNLGGAVQGLLQDTGLISHLYFRSVHNEAGEDDFVGFWCEVQLHFVERNHSLRASQEYFSVTGHAKGILIDGSGEAFVGDEQQFAAGGGFLRLVDAVAGKAVLRLVKVLEVVAGRAV